MSEDIFSQFFNLFNNNESDVNWELSKQINKHLNKDISDDILQLSNEELNLEELFRFLELNIQNTSKFDNVQSNIRLLESSDYGEWFLDSIQHFDFSKFSIGDLPGGIPLGNVQSSIIGMQLGNLAGMVSKNMWGLSHFGIILPQSETLAINKNKFFGRVEQFDADTNELALALLTLEFITLNLGRYSSPFEKIIENLEKASKDLMEDLKDIDVNPMDMSNPQELMQNISGIEGFDTTNIIEEIIAPLSFYRGVIKSKAKDLNLIQDDTTYDLLMDLSFTIVENPLSEIEAGINELDAPTSVFFEFLINSKSEYSIDDILRDKNLIPTRSEIEDPISWAARTSLPPI